MTVKTLAPVGFARNHINALREAGASCHRIAKAAGVRPGFINGIVYGDSTYQRRHADAEGIRRILALTLKDIPEAVHGHNRYPQPAAQRRLHALAALGFPWSVIARRAGRQREAISRLARTGEAQHSIAAAVTGAYEELRNSLPANEDVTPHVERQTRDTAAANGWHTPHWWDLHGGIDTDVTPTVTPRPDAPLPEAPAKGWEKYSACRGEDPELFYPASYSTGRGRVQDAEAKAVCGRCPVRALCLAAALRREEGASSADGIYGGTTPQERWNNTLEAVA